MKYDHKKIEKKWQKRWLQEKVFAASEKSKKPKFYQLETFPYPSAAGLHVGHPKGYIAEDIHARFMRMQGKEVLYTMGWDAFGLPTENYAIKVGKAPQEVAEENIKNFKRQVQMFGLSYDWDREINTASPDYYRWTQWLFIKLWEKGLAYRAKAKVNWCPKDQTVLANEQVIQKQIAKGKSQDTVGVCERCETPVEQREMEQWFLKITDYAERLLEDLNLVDPDANEEIRLAGAGWPAATIKRQEDWIGKSEGALINFKLKTLNFKQDLGEIEVFTTRPDTLFGATYLVLAPEHGLIAKCKSQIVNWEEVEKYIAQASHKTELMRMAGAQDPPSHKASEGQGKTGIELKGIRAINPATKEEIPIWIADYVLGSYGTGAIMAVPAHDERDKEFAEKFHLPIAVKTLISWDEALKISGGVKKIQYRLRDWSVSRQRYWGVPIPMIHCDACGINPVPEKDLPVELPRLKEYRPKGVPPLASSEKFIKVKCPKCGVTARRDSETLDTFVDSSWYYLRYTDPKNEKEPFDKAKAKHWLPVDLYVIGAEHTVLHLLYSRFITKFLQDEGYLSFSEPFLKLRHVGLIQGSDGQKMSKSRGNVVNPDDIVAEFGADAVRLYEMFMGPFEDGQPWDPRGVIGAERFLKRFVNFVLEGIEAKAKTTQKESLSFIHKTIKKVGDDIAAFKFNTAISALMILLNEIGVKPIAASNLEDIVKLIHPFAPHLGQELWSRLKHDTMLDFEPWPEYDAKLMYDETVQLVIQVNGKVRNIVIASKGISQGEAEKLALASEKVKSFISGKPKKIIFVPGRLINFVI